MKSRGHGSLIKLRKSGFKKTKNLARTVKIEKNRAHRTTRRILKKEINKEDGDHRISCGPDDWNIL